MRRIFTFLIALCITAYAFGQSMEPFCCITQGAELKYVTTDAKGKKETGSSVTKINSVTGSNGNYTVSQTVTIYANGTQVVPPMTVKSEIKNGNASLALGGGMAIEINSAIPVIPADLSVGKELACGDIVVNMNGIKSTQTINSHKVIAQESLTTPAGTFDCYVVEQHYTAKVAFIKVSGIQKIWYSRGVGSVRTEVYDKKGKLASIQTLTEFTR